MIGPFSAKRVETQGAETRRRGDPKVRQQEIDNRITRLLSILLLIIIINIIIIRIMINIIINIYYYFFRLINGLIDYSWHFRSL